MDESDATFEYAIVALLSSIVSALTFCCCICGEPRRDRNYVITECSSVRAFRHQGSVSEDPMAYVPVPSKERVPSPTGERAFEPHRSAEYAVASIGLLRVREVVDMEGNRLDLSRLRADPAE